MSYQITHICCKQRRRQDCHYLPNLNDATHEWDMKDHVLLIIIVIHTSHLHEKRFFICFPFQQNNKV